MNESLAAHVDRMRTMLRIAAHHVGLLGRDADSPVADADALAGFIDSRSSHVAQTALYGYLKTRAGTRFPELFEHDGFLESINIAKWRVWAAAVSDLAVFAGALVAKRGAARDEQVAHLMTGVVATILRRAGTPADAGPGFDDAVDAVRARVAGCEWSTLADDASVFRESPDALVEWAPVVDHLKKFDVEIVRNSVRFRWIEVRRELRRRLDAEALLSGEGRTG